MQNVNQLLRKHMPAQAKLCFARGTVSFNFDLSQAFQRLLKEEGTARKIKLRVAVHGESEPKKHVWNWETQTFPDCLQRLKLSDTEYEAGYQDEDGDYVIISSQDCVKNLLQLAKQKGPSATIYIDLKLVDKGKGLTVSAATQTTSKVDDIQAGPQDQSSLKEMGIGYIRKALKHLATTKPEVEKHEQQTAQKYGKDLVAGMSVAIGNSLICGVPGDKWKSFVHAHKGAKDLPDKFVALFESLEYQDRMHERIVVPNEEGIRHLTIQAIKHGDRVYGFFTDTAFILPKKANMHIPTQLIKSMETQTKEGKRIRKFSVWPPPASMDGTDCLTMNGATIAVPDGTEIVRKDDPDMEQIVKEVIQEHSWCNQQLLVGSPKDVTTYPTKNNPELKTNLEVQMDGSRRAVHVKEGTTGLLIEVFDTPQMLQDESFIAYVDAIMHRELGKSVGPLTDQCDAWMAEQKHLPE